MKGICMLKKLLLPALLTAAVFGLLNNKKKKGLPMLGEKAPSFRARSTKGYINFPKDFNGNWVVFFSHPADFTPVCTTEFMTFEAMKDEFAEINTKLVGLSVDSLSSHLAWLKDIKDNIDYNGMNEIDVDFPLIDDLNGSIAKKYGMIQPKADDTKTVRAVFIIDPKGLIRAILYYPQSTGRNLEEIKRILVALQTADEFGVVTPANWEAGDEVIIPPPASKEEAIERLEAMDNVKCYDWFLCFKKLPKESIDEKLLCEECDICNN